MMSDTNPKLHWTQRIALVRHNLHAARRTNDFSFFKTLQAHALIEGTDHVALLYSALGDNADSILSTLDNLNAGIAYVHQDAFKAVYDGAKSAVNTMDDSLASRKSLLRVDVCQQRDMADHAIDKTANSAINFIESQPVHCQDAVANAWVTGTTIVADAVSVCINEMAQIEDNLDDFIRLEYSWSCIQSSVDSAISALRGIFSLMAASNTNTNFINNSNPTQGFFSRNLSVSSASGSDQGGNSSTRSRNSSTASAFSFIKRALSHGQMQPPPVAKTARTGSIAIPMPEANPRGFRASMSAACPTKMSTFGDHPHTVLTTIPPTPATESGRGDGDLLSPFKDSDDYFAFEQIDKSKQSGAAEDLLQLESLDPLYSPIPNEAIKAPVPITLRRMSESFDMGPSAAIAV
ncbi:hypothetical protein FB567DRAFT_267449 [Paraphoma chrysanthemicola]|uniref:Uncharacterized protein n=1 Tax=Paraphoma chrysanthemicola TaxID=798071 RepID=A0A8K0RCP4_9PLEO|nr:hypothetical protein FB567DRAFT_267449 [Paraphoma chrysanthemicola]